jgi:hypothetical protein
MKLKPVSIGLFLTISLVYCTSPSTKQSNKNPGDLKIEFVRHDSEKKIDVMADGRLFTTYRWHDPIFLNIMKPVLYPVMTSAGTEVTRGYPLNPRPGERLDHLHQVGVCFNYGNVNGYDFWGNSAAIPENKRGKFGTIEHLSIDELSGGDSGHGMMVASESWKDPSGKELLAEKTEYHFFAKGTVRIIDRITKLTATDTAVSMKDTKEGGFGIRVARQLELPSQEEVVLTDAQGNPETVKKMSVEGITGNYRSSEGITGDAVYGTRGKWVDLYGNIGDEKISIVMVDHPKNPGHPTYWHARGYGLLLANPLGAGVYSEGKNVMNFSIPARQSATFRFRLIINSGADLTDAEINSYTEDFAGKY